MHVVPFVYLGMRAICAHIVTLLTLIRPCTCKTSQRSIRQEPLTKRQLCQRCAVVMIGEGRGNQCIFCHACSLLAQGAKIEVDAVAIAGELEDI